MYDVLDISITRDAKSGRYVHSYSFYRTQVYLGSDLWVRVSLSDLCADLTDVTLADEDTNSILTDNANRAIQGNVSNYIIWLPTLEIMQEQTLNQF